ncbi:MAG TPA: ABC transporter permease [Stellaceae bacterium]|nr:ABC transporter permease [Stellaceae bacterium]
MKPLDSIAGTAPLRRPGRGVLLFARAQPLGALALAAILLMLVAGVFARFIAPANPVAIDFGAILSPPSAAHPFGTDNFGRDILSRIIYGARTALIIGFTSSFLGCTLGTLLGVTSAFYGGRVDLVIQRFVDTLLSFPIIVLALVVVAMLGRHLVLGIDANLLLAIAIPITPQVARVIRSAALSIRAAAFIDAARIAGIGDARIIFRHMLPNVMAPFLIMLTAFIAQAILLEASLSFLGLGVSEPTPAWGLMLAGNAVDFYREAPWIVIFPGLAISAAVFAFNFLGDSLRDWLDPRFRA